ncbi:hypothetical protein GIB67_027966 [Kingdonia uniflora]|uniref:Uncharacterized protein n=1 Tax=Kingdonia uniflora TaxID=39325 RepID=A0A7J7LGW1_9MAGN|nr:hypothetical protein GIB67_027966 [Kingdonia uniflora]
MEDEVLEQTPPLSAMEDHEILEQMPPTEDILEVVSYDFKEERFAQLHRSAIGFPDTRRQLLDRWRGIEEDDEVSWSDELKQKEIRRAKEEWFSDTFNYLITLPKETHIWCGSWDLMGSLLETFYNYSKDKRDDSHLRRIWKRISQEMRVCTQCICQHHQAQEMYKTEYESSYISNLLSLLRSLDEERVTEHLKEINTREGGKYDTELHNAEVVSVMFEVLMFPVLLDDQSLSTEFQIFIEAVDGSHELTLAGHQQYPGVYALLFLRSRGARSIGLRLAGYMGKLRRAEDLEPLQPLLKKCISFLETEALPSSSDTTRPRVQLERITVWLGIKALLGFLEPPAFEEGILERYPVFLSIVLNHVSDDSPEFTYAVNCLRLLFEMLGCKLWLRTTLSPSVMRNTLLGQCFHTRNEKSHKEIFDLFRPFLQASLQDGEHEKQRRHFIYFLLHQVNMSSNFSILMRKKACQIALLIIHRGYKMNPPCPPFECAHMWAPSLISSLKDSSLHSSLRQPAFDLIHTIIVSDATALIISMLKFHKHPSVDSTISAYLEDDEEYLTLSEDVEEKDTSCWCEFSAQSKLIFQECRGWLCVPMLWFDVLVEVIPSVLPISFSKAVLWSLSRFSMVEPENSTEMALPVRDWLSSYAGNISGSFGWQVPTGSDDGGDGKESKNSIKASTMCISLIKVFKRFTAQFVIQMEHGELWRQWTWEPRMAESMILLLLDPNDNVRQVDRLILEHVSKTQGLSCALQFLCTSGSSLSAIFSGLKHTLKLVLLDTVISNFQNLHHLFFVVRKILKEATSSPQKAQGNIVNGSKNSSFLAEGGFLRQPDFNASPVKILGPENGVDAKCWERFSCLLSACLWPSMRKCLLVGKEFINNKNSQMTCVRLLEVLPAIYERLYPSPVTNAAIPDVFDFKWLLDLVDWGKSSLAIITRYWKQCVNTLLNFLKRVCGDESTKIIQTIETLLSRDGVVTDELKKQVSCLSISLSAEASHYIDLSPLKPKCSILEIPSLQRIHLDIDTEPSHFEDIDVQLLDSKAKNEADDKLIVLSDDEVEKKDSPDTRVLSHSQLSRSISTDKKFSSSVNKISLQDNRLSRPVSAISTSRLSSQKHGSNASRGKQTPIHLVQSKGKCSDETASSRSYDQASSVASSATNMDIEAKNDILKEIIRDKEEDTWEAALKAAKRPQRLITQLGPAVPKRQVIQLSMPLENKTGYLRKLNCGVKRLSTPRLDEWYKPILELDYFSTVGLSSANEDEKRTSVKLMEVPSCFESPEHYVKIFRPLVLEEFKAQLHSSFMEASSSEEMWSGSISVLSVERVDDFHLVRCVIDDSESTASRGVSENDLILLTKQPLQKSAHDFHMIGKVERREKDQKKRPSILVIKFYLQNGSPRLNKAKRFLIERSKWYLSRIMSITSQLREFQALSSLNDIPIISVILKPTTARAIGSMNESKKVDLSKLSQPLQRVLKSSFNDSQLQAIGVAIGTHDSRRECELSLIQGPPGTGKTRTILAIVSGILALRSRQRNDMASKSLNSSTSFTNQRAKISESAAIARAWQDAAYARQISEDVEKNPKSADNFLRGRVLLCAQSNAAVDELISRISKEGLYGSDGELYKPYLVRVGNAKTVHPCSLPFFIDNLVDERLEEEKVNKNDTKNDSVGDSSTILRSNLEKIVDRIRFYEAKRANIKDGSLDPKGVSEDGAPYNEDAQEMSDVEVGAKLNKLYQQKREISRDLSAAQAKEKKDYEEIKALKSKLRKSILREAEIVVTTLSGCGGDLHAVCSESLSNYKFGNSSEHTLFDAVVIDEAAQALEPATLIPLQLLKSNATKCVMVGDPKQLPATVLSHNASKFLYECSMFERLQRAGHPVVMLTEQYRMHPEICMFPSLHFYDNKLINGDNMTSKSAPFHEVGFLGPYIFFDVTDGQECHGKSSGAMSLYNECEANAAVELLRFFKKRYPSEFYGGRIGIISPYKKQVSILRSRFSSAFGSSETSDMEFNTVDGFQGREVDILILSTVRASSASSTKSAFNSSIIGFVADVRRMNVALTRAKLSLWIIGNANTLQTNQNWAALLKNANERKLIISAAKPYEFVSGRPLSSTGKKPSFTSSSSHSKHLKPTTTKDEVDGTNTKNANHIVEKYKGRPEMDRRRSMQDSQYKRKELERKQVNSVSKQSSGKEKYVCEKSGSKTKSGDSQQEPKAVNRTLKVEVLQGMKVSEHGMNQNKSETSQATEPSGVETPKDLVTTRKRQRDAVDALLSSSLISSKKLDTTCKSGLTNGAIRPPKQRKAPSTSSTRLLQDRESMGTSQQTHRLLNTKDRFSSARGLDKEWKSFKDRVQDL